MSDEITTSKPKGASKDYMLDLFRTVGKIEGMLAQFLGLHEVQSRRIDSVERRVDTIEKDRAKLMGYVAGISTVVVIAASAASYALKVFWGAH